MIRHTGELPQNDAPAIMSKARASTRNRRIGVTYPAPCRRTASLRVAVVTAESLAAGGPFLLATNIKGLVQAYSSPNLIVQMHSDSMVVTGRAGLAGAFPLCARSR